jgi:hypothetical protein
LEQTFRFDFNLELLFRIVKTARIVSESIMASASGRRKRLDVITIGRCSVDLYGQQIGSRLEDVTSFAKSIGGCPSNIAIGTSRLGLYSGWTGS